jgi:glyceraldehyde-3-phosphate dehydrogenase/erythrose-4-phosphate dehydrogenase
MINASSPESIDYTQYDIDDALVIDNTGVKRDREGLSKHLLAKGVSKVLLTAPGKGDIPNIVAGVNNLAYEEGENIFSLLMYHKCHRSDFVGYSSRIRNRKRTYRNGSLLYQ